MKFNRSVYISAAAAVLAVAGLATAGAARAGGVSWSVGVSSPGVVVGVSNAPPVYYAPQPVYVQPQPVYVQPAPVYVQPRTVYYAPQPVYVQPAPVYVRPMPVYRVGWVAPGWRYRHEGRHGGGRW
ncbi:hypothetical protein [Variovorax terrae]|uniref:PXPV repeat-containing protein n=1 Tax=Variovorax terrae TaxID=2923278 RepID=A0A9X1VSB7_9BURK|nr:hypothetical protein [Variovorax terrae]MCJ0762447.1 hypothetical protein [Variovorax terrae]